MVAVEQVGQADLLQCLLDFKVMEVLVEQEVQQQVILHQVQMELLIEAEAEVVMVILALHLQLLEETVVQE